jgi:hypothetical protein
MKKLLPIAMIVFMISINVAEGQTCTPGPLTPGVTVPYTYAVTISAINGYTESGNFTWYVTTDPSIITGAEVPATGNVITVGSGLTYGKTSLAPGQKSIILTWSPDAIAIAATSPYYLVVKYGQNNGTCIASNIKVWKINPLNSFLLAIEAVDNAGASSTGVYCAPDITGIVINPTDDKATYTYGENTFYSKVTASNIVGEWTPSVKIPTLNTGQTIKELSWSSTIAGTYTTFTGAANSTGGEFPSAVNATAAADGSLPIYIKLTITNGTWEGSSDQNINIGVDGVYSSGSLKDVKSSSDCSEEANFGKMVTQTIKARPEILTDTPSGSPLAVPTAPATNFLIP